MKNLYKTGLVLTASLTLLCDYGIRFAMADEGQMSRWEDSNFVDYPPPPLGGWESQLPELMGLDDDSPGAEKPSGSGMPANQQQSTAPKRANNPSRNRANTAPVVRGGAPGWPAAPGSSTGYAVPGYRAPAPGFGAGSNGATAYGVQGVSPPVNNSPAYNAPGFGSPVYGAPGFAPGYGAPGFAPGIGARANTAPAGNAPAVNAPAGNPFAGSAPAANLPAGNAPAGNAPGYYRPALPRPGYPVPGFNRGYFPMPFNVQGQGARNPVLPGNPWNTGMPGGWAATPWGERGPGGWFAPNRNGATSSQGGVPPATGFVGGMPGGYGYTPPDTSVPAAVDDSDLAGDAAGEAQAPVQGFRWRVE